MADAVDKIFTEHLDEYFSNFDSSLFRTEKLWNEECDFILKRGFPYIKAIY